MGVVPRLEDSLKPEPQPVDSDAQMRLFKQEIFAYVDGRITKEREFVGDIVKKLPLPSRLSVEGRVRKTLTLHFVCVHSGREFAVESKDWSKWLKMGFALLKGGRAVFDVSTGNVLGASSRGAEAIKDIYEAYKSKDDDEFNVYMSNPFLTSAEQDVLIEKLRKHDFFDKFSYDAQKGGWYLNRPEEDGNPPPRGISCGSGRERCCCCQCY